MPGKSTTALAIALIIVCAYAYSLRSENKSLRLELAYSNASNEGLEKSIKLQNEQIEKLKIVKREPIVADLSHVEAPKDNTCQSELNAYKALFRELSK